MLQEQEHLDQYDKKHLMINGQRWRDFDSYRASDLKKRWVQRYFFVKFLIFISCMVLYDMIQLS